MKLSVLIFSILFLPFTINRNGFENAPGQTTNTHKRSQNTTDNAAVKFGVMVAKTEGKLIPPEKQVAIAKALGVNYIRARIDVQGWGGSNAAYDTYTAGGLRVLLNINYGIPRSATGEFDPVPFPADMDAYSKSLNSILDKYKPEVVAIENEEDNPNYHAGSADDYINELKTAIEVAHSKGLKITNGGITLREICLIIYDDYVQRGQKDKAMDFAKRVFPPMLLQRLNNLDNPMVARQLEFGRKIIAAYKTPDLDYINFHSYEPVRARGQAAKANSAFDPQAFAFVVNYLKTTTGKPVLTNEFGTFNTSPELTKNLLQAVKDGGLSYAIFYSADGGTGKAVALQNASGDLRENGIAFRDFVVQY